MPETNIPEFIRYLTKIEKEKIAFINQPIGISELFVTFQKMHWGTVSFITSKGEFFYGISPEKYKNRLTRLVHHIEILAALAQQYHEDHYCKDGKSKPEAMNKITRISLNEFALYTNGTPLIGSITLSI
jgi:hypothetical protein